MAPKRRGDTDASEVVAFLKTYGMRPFLAHPAGQQLKQLSRDGTVPDEVTQLLSSTPHHCRSQTLRVAKKFITAARGRRALPHDLSVWANQRRSRGDVATDSDLGRALVAARRRSTPQVARMMSGLTPTQSRRQAAAVPAKVSSAVSTGGVALTPASVVNWLYQCLVDLGNLLNVLVGSTSFDERGGTPDVSCGCWCLMWGSDIGARREQAFLAHDVDVDVACFLRPGAEWATIWAAIKQHITGNKFPYVLSESADGRHFRLSPKDPVTIFEFKELKYEVARSAAKPLGRSEIVKRAGRRLRSGDVVRQPAGVNFIDIEVYTIQLPTHVPPCCLRSRAGEPGD